jgi:hypothetical protein
MKSLRRLPVLLGLPLLLGAAAGQTPPRPPVDGGVDAPILARIRDAALDSDWAYQRLAELTDRIGPRLSGSPQLEAAVQQVAAALRGLGARVTLQPVKVPHWVRGAESAQIVQYPGQPAGLTQRLHLTALGGSSATPDDGLTAEVIVIRDFDELEEKAQQVRGRIVLFETHFDQHQADNGRAGAAYGRAGKFRFRGPAAAARLGAAAALVSSIGAAEFRLPHTGATTWTDHQAPIPAAALALEDADLIVRLAAQGPVRLQLVLTPRTLPDADSANVIADWVGRERPDEVVIVSGHLDSWDLGTGAIDDGVGVFGSAGVIAVLQKLDLHPRRTIRFIAWTNEENGSRGAKAYFDSVSQNLATQIAAVESDIGGGRALGIQAAVDKETLSVLDPVMRALGPVGATTIERRDDAAGADIAELGAAGVPGFAPLVDARHYFDYHHTAADTLDKVDPESLRTQVATMAVLAYFLADMPQPLPRAPAKK